MNSYDLWYVECVSLHDFLKVIDKYDIRIYHLKKIDSYTYCFIAKSVHRYIFKKLDYNIKLEKNIGRYRYLFNFILNRSKLIFVFVFLLTIYFSSSFIWSIQVLGHYHSINESLKSFLDTQYIQQGSRLLNLEQLTLLSDKIKENFSDEIDYLNIYQLGSIFYIDYTKKVEDEKVELDYRNIYACKPGMIESFEVYSGNIKVKVNDYVDKGELLVENSILSSSDELKFIPTLGKVYAYTFLDIEVSMVSGDSADLFNELLLKIRESLPKECIIEKENVVQFIESNGTTTLKVHYTLIENIACKGE